MPAPPVRLFLAHLTLPVRAAMVGAAVDCTNQVAQTLAFTETETFGVKLAVEEAFLKSVAHYPDAVNEDERIHLEFHLEHKDLIISIKDKGIPFAQEHARLFSDDDSDNEDMLAIHRFMDSAETLVHGRDGREIRLTKRTRPESLPAELMQPKKERRKRKRTTVKSPIIRLARRAEDMVEICRLAWRCYGYTHEELLYDPDLLTEQVMRGDFKSVIAIDPESGNIIGHIGLKYHTKDDISPELGLAFVDPAFRSPRLPQKMAAFLFDVAREGGAKGIFDCSVTTHTHSQKGMHDMGSRPCCLMLGITASGLQAKELATSKQEKGSVVNHYSAFDRSPGTIFIPDHHQEMVNDIYRWIEVPRTMGTPDAALPSGASSISRINLPDALNVSFVIVHTIGATTAADVAAELRQCRRERKQAVFAFIPTSVGTSPGLVNECEKMGFFFCGVMPHIHDGQDRMLLQYLDFPLDLDAIHVFGDMSKKLFSYVKAEQHRILGAL